MNKSKIRGNNDSSIEFQIMKSGECKISVFTPYSTSKLFMSKQKALKLCQSIQRELLDKSQGNISEDI